jgi:hypothetical protein
VVDYLVIVCVSKTTTTYVWKEQKLWMCSITSALIMPFLTVCSTWITHNVLVSDWIQPCHFTIDIRRMSSSVLMSRVLDIGELCVSVFSLFICCVVCCSPFYYLINVCTVKQHLSLCVCSLFFYWHSIGCICENVCLFLLVYRYAETGSEHVLPISQ